MAEEKQKKSPILEFREKLKNSGDLKALVLEGLKSSNARVRALAAKTAFKVKDHALIKKNVLPLIESDKSKKVIKALSQKITRKNLTKKLKDLMAAKPAPKKAEKAEGESA